MAERILGGRRCRPIPIQNVRAGMILWVSSCRPNENEWKRVSATVNGEGGWPKIIFLEGGGEWRPRAGGEQTEVYRAID